MCSHILTPTERREHRVTVSYDLHPEKEALISVTEQDWTYCLHLQLHMSPEWFSFPALSNVLMWPQASLSVCVQPCPLHSASVQTLLSGLLESTEINKFYKCHLDSV